MNMNKLLFSEGGQPLYLDDIDFLQTSLFEGYAPFFRNFGNCVLQGCEVTIIDQNRVSWTSGVVLYNGEIFAVPSGSGATNSITQSAIGLRVVRTPTEPRVFGDGVSRPTHELGTAELTLLFQPRQEEVFMSLFNDNARFVNRMRSFVGGSEDILLKSFAGRTQSKSLVRYVFPPGLAIIKGTALFSTEQKNTDGLIMNYRQELGELSGKGMVVSPTLPEGSYVSIEGYGIILYSKTGERITSIPADTKIAFTIIEV